MYQHLDEQEKTYEQSIVDDIERRGATKVTIDIDECIEVRAEGKTIDVYFLHKLDSLTSFKRGLFAIGFKRFSITIGFLTSKEVFTLQKEA